MRIILKNQPKLQLADLLKRRKMTLLQFVTEHAITTYEGLCARCERMGVAAPDEEAYGIGVPFPVVVNSPQEGVIVIEPPPVVDEISGKNIDPDAPIIPDVVVVTDAEELSDEPTMYTPKRSRKKKDNSPID